MFKKIVVPLILLSAVTAGLAYTFRADISMKIVDNIVTERMKDPMASIPDGLHIALCGTGSPFPDPQRGAPCTVVIAGKDMFLFDAGSGAAKQISRMSLSTGQLKGIFLTHFHSDHIDGLGEVMMTRWAQNTSPDKLKLYGPTGIREVYEGFHQAYGHDTEHRTAHHTAALMPSELSGAEVSEFITPKTTPSTVYKTDDLEIKAFAVDHQPIDPAIGYIISYKGRTVVLSGDTKKSAAVARAAKGADLLIHEALSVELVEKLHEAAVKAGRAKLGQIFIDIQNYHTTPVEVAEVAKEAQVGAVVLSHIVPPLPLPPMKEIFLGKAPEVFKGPFRIGEDGDFISLPPKSKAIEYARRWN
jgi:ribonuclease Z